MDFVRIAAKLQEQLFQFHRELSLGQPLHHGNDLWDSSPSVGTVDGSGAAVGREDLSQEDSGKVIAAGGAMSFVECPDRAVDPDGSAVFRLSLFRAEDEVACFGLTCADSCMAKIKNFLF
jgi:hypothetical protein